MAGGPSALRVQPGRPRPPVAAVALCLLLMLAFGAAAGAAVLTAGNTTAVIVAARRLPAGSVVGRQDLTVAQLGGEGLRAVSAGDGGRLLGKTVLADVPSGTLLNSAMFASQPLPAPGQVAVGLALVPGQLPAQLAGGDRVSVLALPAKGPAVTGAGGGPAATGGAGSAQAQAQFASVVLVPAAQVLSAVPAGTGGTLVTVVVDARDAPRVTAASYAGLVGLVLLPAGVS